MTLSNIKLCSRCTGPGYRCRSCGKLTCEHFCGNKVDTGLTYVEATCTSCYVRKDTTRTKGLM